MEPRQIVRGQSRQLKPVRPNNHSVVIGFFISPQGFRIAMHSGKVAKIINADTSNCLSAILNELQINDNELSQITFVVFANLNEVQVDERIRHYLCIIDDQQVKVKHEKYLVCLKEEQSGVRLENSGLNWIYGSFNHVQVIEHREDADIYNEVVKDLLKETYHNVREEKKLDEVDGFVMLNPDKYIPKKIVIPASLNLTPDLQNEFMKKVDQFLIYRDKLWKKQQDLRDRGHITAANQAEDLHRKLSVYAQTYLNDLANPNISSPEKKYEDFKTKSLRAISKARGELETHRGWKRFLVNFAACIASLIIFFPLVLKVHHHYKKHYLFFDRTSSHKKLDKLENSINHLEPSKLQQ